MPIFCEQNLICLKQIYKYIFYTLDIDNKNRQKKVGRTHMCILYICFKFHILVMDMNLAKIVKS